MATSPANSIALPPELYSALEQFARTVHLPVSAVAEHALRSYIDEDPALEHIRQHHRARAASLGLTQDEYVEMMIHEYRAEKRAQTP
jgi:predicted transcriptional regulator